MSYFSPLSPSSHSSTALPGSKRAKGAKEHFQLEGTFQGFASGKKSPFKYLMVNAGTEDIRIKLKKSLRMMLFRYLEPGDWVRVVGRQKWDRDRDEISFKADEVVRITQPHTSPQTCTAQGKKVSSSSKKSKAKSAKILICQKSGCRKRGAKAVGDMVERSLSDLGLSDQVMVKYTGCMDRCKAGPNVVFTPKKAKYTRVEPGAVPDLVRQHCAHLSEQ